VADLKKQIEAKNKEKSEMKAKIESVLRERTQGGVATKLVALQKDFSTYNRNKAQPFDFDPTNKYLRAKMKLYRV
jgi:hypothetical protein